MVKKKAGKSEPPQQEEKRPMKGTPLPAIYSVSSEGMMKAIKNLAAGWDSELENLLAPPESLFRSDGYGIIFSSDKEFKIDRIVSDLSRGRLSEDYRTYGIFVYETSSTVYFVLADTKRRIIVKQRLSSLHTPDIEGWKGVKRAIKDALSGAPDKGVALMDNGHLSTLQYMGAEESRPLMAYPPKNIKFNPTD